MCSPLTKSQQSLRYHNRKGKPEEDEYDTKPAPIVVQPAQSGTVVQSAFSSVTTPLTLDPAVVWPTMNPMSTGQPFSLPSTTMLTNPGLNPSALGSGLFHSMALFNTLQKAANEERLQEELWRNLSVLHGAQVSTDRLLSAYSGV